MSLKAHYYFCTNISKFKPKREENIIHNVEYNHPEIYKGSIVYDFFVKGIKKFSDINFSDKH